MIVGVNITVFISGLVVLGFGAVLVAGVTIKVRELTVEHDKAADQITHEAGRRIGVLLALVGTGLAIAGLVLHEDQSGSEALPATTTSSANSASTEASSQSSTLGRNQITIDRPPPNEVTDVTCDAPDSCWIRASGRLGNGSDAGSYPYLLIAADEPGSQPEYYVQYDSTSRDGDTWSAQGYVESGGPGSYVLKAVLVTRKIEPPPSGSGGLTWDAAQTDQGIEPAAEFGPVRITTH